MKFNGKLYSIKMCLHEGCAARAVERCTHDSQARMYEISNLARKTTQVSVWYSLVIPWDLYTISICIAISFL